MLEKHKTKDGRTILIAQMSDEHLNNFIALVLRKVEKAQQAKQQGVTAYHRRLYNLPKIDEESIAEVTREALQRLYPYFAEAYLRDLEDPRKMLTDILGREEAVPDFSGVPQLPDSMPHNLGDLDDTEADLEDVPIDL
jgi:hypothetical protein